MLWRLWGPLIWLYYRGWPANTGPNMLWRLWGPLTWLHYRGWPHESSLHMHIHRHVISKCQMPPKKCYSKCNRIRTHSRLDHLRWLRETCCWFESSAATRACLVCTPPCNSNQTQWTQPSATSTGHQIAWLTEISMGGRNWLWPRNQISNLYVCNT